MAVDYRDAARYFNGRTVVVTMTDATVFVGTLHPCPHDGRDHVEIRCPFVAARCDTDDIADIRPHRRGRTPAPAPAPVRRTRSGKVRP